MKQTWGKHEANLEHTSCSVFWIRDVNETKIWCEREWEQSNEDENENETNNHENENNERIKFNI